jgi:peptidoglycan hydrolase-like protein with peptidoglycan-binding domain
MARTGIAQVDALVGGGAAPPLGAANATAEAVGFIQDLLIGHDFTGIPGPLGTARGTFGPRTTEALRAFQGSRGLPATGAVDALTLQEFVRAPWPRPIACCGDVALVLDVAFTGLARLVSLTSQFEGAGLFAAVNRNTDRAGLSFGLIQWAQKPGRLHELLQMFSDREPALFTQIFGRGDAAVARGLLAHTAALRGGTDAGGHTVDPRFDLVSDDWVARFREAGASPALQRVQLDCASAAFLKSLSRLQLVAPQLHSERAIAFMLDVANQHGDGGAADILRTVQHPAMSQAELLMAVEQESVARVRKQFGDGPEVRSTASRRSAFRTTALLSDEPLAIA